MIDYKEKKEALIRWIKAHKSFAIALPIVLVLCSFFVIENVNDIKKGAKQADKGDAFDTTIPGRDPELKEVDGNKLWFQKEEMYNHNNANNDPIDMVPNKKVDSIDAIVERLETMSMESIEQQTGNAGLNAGKKSGQGKESLSVTEQKQKTAEQKMAYREMLRKGKEEITGAGRNLSPSQSIDTQEAASKNGIAFRAVVYKDQFVMPNDVAKLILTNDVVVSGHIFKKNTILYGVVQIEGNRIHFDINNINHIPVDLVVKDYNDGMLGLYSKRAGVLWNEFQSETQNSVLNDGVNEIRGESRVLTSVVSEIGTYFRKKKYKQKDKVLLINDRELILIAK